jgi:hypothetical protein
MVGSACFADDQLCIALLIFTQERRVMRKRLRSSAVEPVVPRCQHHKIKYLSSFPAAVSNALFKFAKYLSARLNVDAQIR